MRPLRRKRVRFIARRSLATSFAFRTSVIRSGCDRMHSNRIRMIVAPLFVCVVNLISVCAQANRVAIEGLINGRVIQNIQACSPKKQEMANNQKEVDANSAKPTERSAELNEYISKERLDVHFASSSAEISMADQLALKKLANNAIKRGYVIQVRGFSDSHGSPLVNLKLSMERAQNVIVFLIQNCNVSVRRIVAPGAFGDSAPLTSNDTSAGRAENRRVEVRALMNTRRTGA